jgi:hypothetical protein
MSISFLNGVYGSTRSTRRPLLNQTPSTAQEIEQRRVKTYEHKRSVQQWELEQQLKVRRKKNGSVKHR